MPRPNVIVFLTDQQRYDTMGAHGCPLDLTPNLDRLARENLFVEHSFTCQPVCGPSRACLQTGIYPSQSGQWTNGRPLLPGTRTLGSQFLDGGYETAYIGKWHLGPSDSDGPVASEYRLGYENWLASNCLEFTSDAYHTRMFDGEGQPHDYPGYRVDALTDAAIRLLADRDGERPLFLFLSYLEPHQQNDIDDFPAPVGYAERYEKAWMPPDLVALRGSSERHWPGYCGMVKRLDEALGRLVDALISLGIWDETVLLFTSDHGCHFKTRNGEYKRSGHEASIRVPTVLAGPSLRGRGRLPGLVSSIDVPPTLLELAGLEVPVEMQGQSFIDGGSDDVLVQVSENEVGRALRTEKWKYGVIAPEANAWNEPWATEYREAYLYDLEADPYELDNRIGDPRLRDARDRLRARLIQRIEAAGDPRPEILASENLGEE